MWIILQNYSVLCVTLFTELQLLLRQGMTVACPPKPLWYRRLYKENIISDVHAVGRSLCYGSEPCNLQHNNRILTINPTPIPPPNQELTEMNVVIFSALRKDKFPLQAILPVLISVRGWVHLWKISRPEGLCQWNITMTQSGIEHETLRNASNNCATACGHLKLFSAHNGNNS